MARKQSDRLGAAGDEGASQTERIRRAGIVLFKKYGYHGTSVRALAEAVGLEAASLYHHFSSKQMILAEIFDRAMDELADGQHKALATEAAYEQRLRDFIRFHVLYHVERQDEAFISHSELRSLTARNCARVNAKRDRYERTFRSFLSAGVDAGEFRIRDVQVMAIAILVMCSGVSDWFADHGRLSGEQVADEYAEIVLDLARGGDRSGPGGSSGRNFRREGDGAIRVDRHSRAPSSSGQELEGDTWARPAH